jgi:hypothetical protein
MIGGVTLYLADDAAYQGPLTVADYVRAEFDIINFKISHGLKLTAVRPDVAARVAEARRRGKGVSTFAWIIGNHTGAEQAEFAYERIRLAGALDDAAHVLDVEEQQDADDEDPPTWQQVVDYVNTMKRLRRRTLAIYSGDWRWPAGWKGSTLTPYLHAATDAGYPGKYPGDTAAAWNTSGWGGWRNLTIMQYAVAPLTYPGGGTSAPTKVSKSAIRDPDAWAALTGGTVTTGAWNPPRGQRPDFTLLPDAKTHRWLLTYRVSSAHRWFVERLLAMEPNTELGGAYVDKAGHHNARENLPATDYSVRHPSNQRGPADKSSGTDWTHNAAHSGDYSTMVKYGKRIRAAWNAGDPRLNGWREALGQFDIDKAPEAIDFLGDYERVPDGTHSWHWHFSEIREFIDSYWNKWAFLTILLGWTLAEWQQSIKVTAPEDTTMALTDRLTLSGSACLEWGKPAGYTLDLEEYFSLSAIYTGRAARQAALARATTAAILEKVTDDDADRATILAAIKQSETNVISGLAAADLPSEEIAQMLRAALGDRAEEVGEILAAGPAPAS